MYEFKFAEPATFEELCLQNEKDKRELFQLMIMSMKTTTRINKSVWDPSKRP